MKFNGQVPVTFVDEDDYTKIQNMQFFPDEESANDAVSRWENETVEEE